MNLMWWYREITISSNFEYYSDYNISVGCVLKTEKKCKQIKIYTEGLLLVSVAIVILDLFFPVL